MSNWVLKIPLEKCQTTPQFSGCLAIFEIFAHLLSFQGPPTKKTEKSFLIQRLHQNEFSREHFGTKTKAVL